MKRHDIAHISYIFAIITAGLLILYTLINMSTFFVFNIVDIPLTVTIAYASGSLLAVFALIIVFKQLKKILIGLAIWSIFTVIAACIYIILLNLEEFKTKIASLFTPEFAIGFILAVILFAASILLYYIIFKKKDEQ